MATFRSFPRKLKPMKGRGLITCALSGFLRRPCDTMMIKGRPVAKDKADLYGAFGTTHPQNVAAPEVGGDPTPVPHGGYQEARSKQELGISDREMRDAIREDRQPRPGY